MSVQTNNSDFKEEATIATAKLVGVHESLLQESEKDIIWYRDNFFGKDHQNYIAVESPKGPLAVSTIFDEETHKIMIRTDQGSERVSVPNSSIKLPWYRKIFGFGPAVQDLFATFNPNFPAHCLRLCKNPSLPKDLLAMEERQVIRSYKFGLVYIGPGQSTEEQMFGNRLEDCSSKFTEFLNFLGEKIELKGWKGYRAGLDVNENNTGANSVYTKWQGYEIMFHVSVYLPYNEKDKQQLEKKRHIGNDIVILLFQDSDVPFQISTITSKQNHVIAFVKPVGNNYKLTIVSKNGVPQFSPELPEPCLLERNAVSRDFLLHKLVNGERACYKAPSFAPKISRTRAVLLNDVTERYIGST